MLKYSRVSGKRFRIKLQLRPDQSLSIHGETAKIWNIQGKKNNIWDNGTPLQWFIYTFGFSFV